MAILLFIAISSLNVQYGCRSFCTSALTVGQPCNTYSDSKLRCSSSMVTDLISSPVMQSGMSMHDYGIHGYVHSQHFFVSVYLMVVFGWPIHYEQLGLGWYSILMLYWWMHSYILCSLCVYHCIIFEDCHLRFVDCCRTDFLDKTVAMEFSRPCNIPKASIWMLLYRISVLVRPLLENVIGQEYCIVRCFISWEPQSVPHMQKNCYETHTLHICF